MKGLLILIFATLGLSGCSMLKGHQDRVDPSLEQPRFGEGGVQALNRAFAAIASGGRNEKSYRELDALVGACVAKMVASQYSAKGSSPYADGWVRDQELEKLEQQNKPYRFPSIDSVAGGPLPFRVQTNSFGRGLDMIVIDVAERRKIKASTLDDFFATHDKGWVDEVVYWLVLYAKCQPEVESASARMAFRDASWAYAVETDAFLGRSGSKTPPTPCFDWNQSDDARWAPISDDAIKYVAYLRCADLSDGYFAMSGEEALFWAVVLTNRFMSASGAREIKMYRERHAENPHSQFWSKAIPLVEKYDTGR